MKKHLVEIKWQALVFGVYLIISLIQAYSEHPKEGVLFSEFVGVINVIISECLLVNVLANWLMIKYPYSKEPQKFILYALLILFLFIVYKFFTAFPVEIDILKSYHGAQDKKTLVFFVFYTTINVVITWLVALGIYSIKKSFRIEKRAIILEKEVNEAKLAMLKHQINPHFLYNTLSYMYAQARPVSKNLSQSILLLSNMMRYSLSKADENSLTALENEIQYIDNFIEIHRLRFDEDFYLDFEIEGVLRNKKIVPLLLITFVENAIKHGKTNDSKNPVKIKISLLDSELLFSVENKKQIGKKDESSGIGLINTRNRLNLAYPNRYKLEIDDKTDCFAVSLKIDLNGD